MPHYERPTFIGDISQYPLVLISDKNQLNQEAEAPTLLGLRVFLAKK